MTKDSHCSSVRLFLCQISEGSLSVCLSCRKMGQLQRPIVTTCEWFSFLMVIGSVAQIKVAKSLELYCYSGAPRLQPWLTNLYTIMVMSYHDETGLQPFHSLLVGYFKQRAQRVFRWRFADVQGLFFACIKCSWFIPIFLVYGND